MRLSNGLIVAGIILLILGLSSLIGGVVLRERVGRAVAATQRVQLAVAQHDLDAACAELGQASAAWTDVATVSRSLAPVLQRLGWVPNVGSDLLMLPDLVEMAQGGTAAGMAACPLLQPIVAAETTPERLAAAAEQLSARPQELAAVRGHLQQAHTAWAAVAPHLDRSQRLAPYRDQLSALGAQLPAAISALDTTQQLGPRLPWLFGLDAPRRYLVVSQNPFELRPTDGFMGTVCVVRVEQARPSSDGCRPSESYDVAAPEESMMPSPYQDYLQLGDWYLRDANWSPDFPTAAHTLQAFWRLNEQPAVDGVIAVDPYALQALLEATGPLGLEGEQIDAERVVDAILSRYYDGDAYRDKDWFGELLVALLEQVQGVEPAKLPGIAVALHSAVAERHLLVTFNDPAMTSVLAERGWDAIVRPTASDALRVVEADVGYGKVNAFVERLTHYDVILDDDLTPLAATLTLTYTNRYSPWVEASTLHEVHSRCTNPETYELERWPGCYANYLRVYVPQGSELLDVAGLEELVEVDQAYGRTVFGGYVRIMQGEQWVVSLQYALPEVAPGSLLIEKQPGTLEPPILVTARTQTDQAELWTSGRTDLTLKFRQGDAGLTIDGPSDPAAAASFARAAAFSRGMAQWQAGERTEAVRTWQEAGVLDQALDHARLLAAAELPDEALALVEAVATVAEDGRAAFEQAVLLDAQGNPSSADRLYQQAAQRSPDNPLAQLVWLSRLAAQGRPLPDLDHTPLMSAAVRRWRRLAAEFEQFGDLAAAQPYVQAVVVKQQHAPEFGEAWEHILNELQRPAVATAAQAP